MPQAYEQALKDNNIEPVSRPELDIDQIGKGKDLIFTAKSHSAKPELYWENTRDLNIEKDTVNITDEDVQKELEKIQDKNARLVSVENRPVKKKIRLILILKVL